MSAETRRQFLMFFGVMTLAATATVGVEILLKGVRPIESIVRTRLSYLTFAEGAVERFAEAVRAVAPKRSSLISRAINDPQKVISALAGRGRALMFDRVDEQRASEFLLSSDFFQNGADTSKVVTFVAYADPYNSSCSNPLVTLD
jgi:hypothetical protein